MFKIGDKVVIISLNEDPQGENFKYYTVIDGVQIKEEGNIYTVGGKRINPDITMLATEEEIKEFYN